MYVQGRIELCSATVEIEKSASQNLERLVLRDGL